MISFFERGNPIGSRLELGRLTIWPLVGEDDPRIGTYRTLSAAQEMELVEVRELGSSAAAGPNVAPVSDLSPESTPETIVPEEPVQQVQQQGSLGGARVGSLLVENRGELPLLLCAGTILTGGLQDRQVARDSVVPAGATLEVEAFCIERGRWRGDRRGVVTEGKFQARKEFTPREVRRSAQYRSDQGEVWEFVDRLNAAYGVSERSQSLVEGLESEAKGSASEREELRERIREHLAAAGDGEAGPLGFCVALDGRLTQARCFATQRAFLDQLEAFAATLAQEVLLSRLGSGPERKSALEDAEVLAELRRVSEGAVVEERALDAMGSSWRIQRKAGEADHAVLAVGSGEERVPVTRDWVW